MTNLQYENEWKKLFWILIFLVVKNYKFTVLVTKHSPPTGDIFFILCTGVIYIYVRYLISDIYKVPIKDLNLLWKYIQENTLMKISCIGLIDKKNCIDYIENN